ncbi:MAG: 16S rRNA (cytidine(1402)-2'-O)-methyltransferase [Pseudomonadota bacterium]
MSEDTPLAPGLYLVSTPIGNARDITLRALDILARADILAAEDTRRTRTLFEIHGLSLRGRRIAAYHDHSGPETRTSLISAVRDGAALAYVSDAGTPLLADPGFRLAAAAVEADVPVFSAPGASALLAALAVAGLPTDRFLFAGFPPSKAGARSNAFDAVGGVDATLVFYESPRRLPESLASMAVAFGPRQAAVCRELTKRFEEVVRGTLVELAERYQDAAVKGEVVVVIGPPVPQERTDEEIDHALADALTGHSLKDAVAAVAVSLHVPRKRVYARALAMTGQ